MNEFKILTYTPEIYDTLRCFMINQYPHRSREYITWWLNVLQNSSDDIWRKTLIIMHNNKIVACMTSKKSSYVYKAKVYDFFYEANTIVCSSMRGRGIGNILYSYLEQFDDRCTIGMTNLAYNIQSSKLKQSISLDPIRVYITINKNIFKYVANIVKQSKDYNLITPKAFKKKGVDFVYINDFSEIVIPDKGKWNDDDVEISRDLKYLEDRFELIWKNTEYVKYCLKKDGRQIGYVVYRKAKLYGLNIIAIVDYRCITKDDEKHVFNGANYIAKINGVGLSICLSSRKYRILSLRPLTIRTPKIIKGLAGLKLKTPHILFTSADSDLDFVYYE